MTNFKDGDTVRVTWEFQTHSASADSKGNILVSDKNNNLSAYVPESSVELVKRRKPKVGDMIGSRAELADLPVKTVVVNEYGDPLLCLAGGTQGNGSYRLPYLEGWDNAPYRVVYVPE